MAPSKKQASSEDRILARLRCLANEGGPHANTCQRNQGFLQTLAFQVLRSISLLLVKLIPLAGEALQDMQHLAGAVSSERARLKARKAASATSAAEEAAVLNEAVPEPEGSASAAEAYFRQRISEGNEEGDQSHDSFQVAS